VECKNKKATTPGEPCSQRTVVEAQSVDQTEPTSLPGISVMGRIRTLCLSVVHCILFIGIRTLPLKIKLD
jgi:hypothetical protein